MATSTLIPSSRIFVQWQPCFLQGTVKGPSGRTRDGKRLELRCENLEREAFKTNHNIHRVRPLFGADGVSRMKARSHISIGFCHSLLKSARQLHLVVWVGDPHFPQYTVAMKGSRQIVGALWAGTGIYGVEDKLSGMIQRIERLRRKNIFFRIEPVGSNFRETEPPNHGDDHGDGHRRKLESLVVLKLHGTMLIGAGKNKQ